MFNYTSRYYNLETAEFTTADGHRIAYKRRRFLPQDNGMPLLAEVIATRDDRLDRITFETLGDPEQFWQICDANTVMNPAELLAEPVQTLRVPLPQI
jgi:hypothetical protein